MSNVRPAGESGVLDLVESVWQSAVDKKIEPQRIEFVAKRLLHGPNPIDSTGNGKAVLVIPLYVALVHCSTVPDNLTENTCCNEYLPRESIDVSKKEVKPCLFAR